MRADRILHVESAGAGPEVTSASDYADPDTPRYSMTAPGDPIVWAQGTSVGPLGHGIDPDNINDVVRLETGLRVHGDPSSGVLHGGDAHSDVFHPTSTAWRNILAVMTGGEAIPLTARGWQQGVGVAYPLEDPSYQPPTMDVQ